MAAVYTGRRLFVTSPGVFTITLTGGLAQTVEPTMTYNASGLSGGTISSLITFGNQKSMIRRISFTFNNYVVVSAGAFTLTMQGSKAATAGELEQRRHHRHDGDIDGTGLINAADINAMAVALGHLSGSGGYYAGLDFNLDGSIDTTTDFPQFATRKNDYSVSSFALGWDV